MAHSYSHLFDLPITMFRFFTVYGPWGRPDMAPNKFAKAIFEGESIDVYNAGEMWRDFTFIDDLVEAMRRLISKQPTRGECTNDNFIDDDNQSPVAAFRVVNIGNSKPIKLTKFIQALENATGRTAEKNLLPMQPGEVVSTWADNALLHALTGFVPETDISFGVANFIAWYREYYQI